MRQIEELKLSEQFSLWRRWEALAFKCFGKSLRPDPPNGNVDGWSVLTASVCFWVGGGALLKYYSVLYDPSMGQWIEAYFGMGVFFVLAANLLISLGTSDPFRRHTADQIEIIRKYNLGMRRLGERLDVDLSAYCYKQYDNKVIDPVPPRRPSAPKPIPSRAPSRLVSTNDEVCKNPHLIERKEEIGLTDGVLTPAGLRRLISEGVIECHPAGLVKRADVKRQELLYRLNETPTIGRQMAVYNFQNAITDKEKE